MQEPPHLLQRATNNRQSLQCKNSNAQTKYSTHCLLGKIRVKSITPTEPGTQLKTCNPGVQTSTIWAKGTKSHKPAVGTGLYYYPGYPARSELTQPARSILNNITWKRSVASNCPIDHFHLFYRHPFFFPSTFHSGLSVSIWQDLLTERQWGFLFLSWLWRGEKKKPLELFVFFHIIPLSETHQKSPLQARK